MMTSPCMLSKLQSLLLAPAAVTLPASTHLQLADLDGGLARHHGVDASRECPISLAAVDACVMRTAGCRPFELALLRLALVVHQSISSRSHAKPTAWRCVTMIRLCPAATRTDNSHMNVGPHWHAVMTSQPRVSSTHLACALTTSPVCPR